MKIKTSLNGFTLIEVMISLAILSTLAVLVAKNIQEGLKSKTKIQAQVDDLSKIRDVLRLIERDLALAFHYRDIELELKEALKAQNKEKAAGTNPGSTTVNQTAEKEETPPEAERVNPVTHFDGTEDAMNFPTMNNGQMLADSKQADFIEVGYSLKTCKSINRAEGSSSKGKCLWRRQSNFVDKDVRLGGTEIVLLENVTEFKLRYIGKGKDDWVSSWKSESTTDAAATGNFPDGVELSLTVDKPEENKKYSMQIVAPIHFPNNQSKEEKTAENTVPALDNSKTGKTNGP